MLVFNYCYHGTVDEAFATLTDGQVAARPDNLGPGVDPAATTKVVEWNDVAALEAALAPGDVACVLAEPAMTNIGIIHPEPGYHAALREITRRTGTLLLIDETHTICTGPGGYTREHGLEPDLFVVGKLVGGGVPAAAYGLSAEVAERVVASGGGGGFRHQRHRRDPGRQRAVPGRHARDPHRGPDRGLLRARDSPRRALHRRGASRSSP